MRSLIGIAISVLLFGVLTSSKSPQTTYNIVIFGDGVILHGNWTKTLERNDIYVFGVGTDITANLKKNTEYIVGIKPKICFVHGGIIDLYNNIPVDDIYANLRSIALELSNSGIKPVIHATLFVSEKEWGMYKWNPKIAELNEYLAKFAKAKGFDFIDMNLFLSQNNSLKNEFSDDGMHLNEKGYQLWAEQIKGVLTKHEI